MPDDEPQVIDDTEIVEDVEPDPELEDEPEPDAELEAGPEPETPSKAEQAWDKTVPELAGQYTELAPDQRESILIKRAEVPPDKPPTVDAPSEAVPTGQEPKAEAPPVIDVPDFNVDRIKTGLTESLSEREAALVADTFAEMRDYFKSMGQLVVATVDQAKLDIGEFRTDLTRYSRPQKLLALMPAIPGATDADVKSAEKILEGKEVTTEQAALELAVYRREVEVKSATPESKKKGEALRAAQLAGPSRRGAQLRALVPTSREDLRAIYRQDAQRKKKA